MYMAMNGSQDTAILDPKISPLLLFHDNYYAPGYESDDEDYSDEGEPEEDAHDDDVSYEEYDTDRSGNDDEPADEEVKKTNDDDDGEAEAAKDTLFFYSISRRQLQGRRVDDLKGHFYWTTPQGWLLMLHRDSHETFLWNPFTRQRVSLPSDQEQFLAKSTTRCLLSHKPTDPNCVVVVVNCRDTVLWYCRPVGTQWFEHKYQSRTLDESRNNVIISMKFLTACGGKFYIDLFDTVVTLEFTPNPTFTKTRIGRPIHLYPCSDSRLLESCGELFRVTLDQEYLLDYKVVHIGVHRLDIAERAYVKVETLGDRVFFVNSRYFGASLGAEEVGLKGNCIYFLRCRDKGLYVYNMERGSTILHNPGQDLRDDVTAEILMPAS